MHDHLRARGRRLYTLIEDERVEWATGDAVYIPVWAWYQHSNTSKTRMCRYVACENAPLMQNLGAAAQAARVPLNRVFYDDVPKNGHLHSCWSDQSEELFHAV